MAVVDTVSRIMDWLAEDVCPLVSLKLPDASKQDAGYEFKEVHPYVLGMYWPTSKQLLPPDVEDVQPGVLVQVVDGTDEVGGDSETLQIRLHLSAWNPGRHGGDVWVPSEGRFIRSEADTFRPGYDDGWRDAWSVLDTVKREVKNAPTFGGYAAVDRTRPVTFGPYEQEGSVVDFYPYFFAHVDFYVVENVPPSVRYAQYL